MKTKTLGPAARRPPLAAVPAFAVTVDVVILTMVERTLDGLLAAGEYRPVIDRTYRLEDVVKAHRYDETRQKTGNVVPSLNGGPR